MTNFNDGQRRNELHDRLDMEQLLGIRQINRLYGKMSTAYAVTKVRQHEFNMFCGVASFEATLGTCKITVAVELEIRLQ